MFVDLFYWRYTKKKRNRGYNKDIILVIQHSAVDPAIYTAQEILYHI